MQKFAVSLTIASLAVALNLGDGEEEVAMILGEEVEVTTLNLDEGEEEAALFDQLDENEDSIPDIFQRVLPQYVLPEEDCSCLTSNGLPVQFNEDGAYITVTFGANVTERSFNYPANYGLTQCAAHDLNLPDFCAGVDGIPLSDAPDYCGQSWCFVNADTCTNGIVASGYFPDANLSYSYDVCAVAEDEAEEEVDEAEEGEEEIEEEEGEGEDEEGEEGEGDEEGEEADEEEVGLEDEPAVEPEEDCSCVITHGDGIELFWTEEGVHYIEYTADGETYQYPPNYGLSQCMAWDADLQPTCADEDGMPLDDAPVWCTNQYCYVNPETCTTPRVRPSGSFPDSGLFYSYEACGDVDVFADEGEVCPGVEETEDAWWNDFLKLYICPGVEERLDAEHEAAQAEEECDDDCIAEAIF